MIARLSVPLVILLGVAAQLPQVRESSAAEPAATPKQDPLLADMKATAEAKWWPRFDRSGPTAPTLAIVVDFHGMAAARASAIGETNLDSIVDENGKSYRWQCLPNGIRWNGMCSLQDNEFIEYRRGDDILFYLTIPNRPTAKFIRQLRGSVAMRTGGEHRAVVVENAFRNLRLSSQRSVRTTIFEMKATICDKNLDALGIKVAAQRQPVEDWEKNNGVKDAILIQVQANDVILDIEFLEANGRKISAQCSSVDHDNPSFCCYAFRFASVIPSDAKLQLAIHRNSRKVRVPFVLENIPVPKIDKHDQSLNVASPPEDAFVEAEALSPGDPILDGLKSTAEAKFYFTGESLPAPIVNAKLQGKLIERTTSFGEIRVESASDESGKPLVFSACDSGMQGRFFHATDDYMDCIEAGVVLSVSSPVHKIHELRGTIALQVAGQFEIIAVKKFLQNVGKDNQIDDPVLRALGISATVNRKKGSHSNDGGEELKIALQWSRNAVVLCDLCDSEGQRLGNGDWVGIGDPPNHVNWGRGLDRPIPEDAELHLVVPRNCRKVRVPFVFKDIDVPPMPMEQDEASGFGGTLVPAEEKK